MISVVILQDIVGDAPIRLLQFAAVHGHGASYSTAGLVIDPNALLGKALTMGRRPPVCSSCFAGALSDPCRFRRQLWLKLDYRCYRLISIEVSKYF